MISKIHLKRNEERRINSGHLWVFSNEIGSIEESPENGDLVEVYDSKNNFLGTGFYNKNSLISVRILSKDKIVVVTNPSLRQVIVLASEENMEQIEQLIKEWDMPAKVETK